MHGQRFGTGQKSLATEEIRLGHVNGEPQDGYTHSKRKGRLWPNKVMCLTSSPFPSSYLASSYRKKRLDFKPKGHSDKSHYQSPHIMAETKSKSVAAQKDEETVHIHRPVDGDGRKDVAAADLKISRFEDVASYNWLDKPEPTILVPGILNQALGSTN